MPPTEDPPVMLEDEETTYIDEYRTVWVIFGGGGGDDSIGSVDTGGAVGGADTGVPMAYAPADAIATPDPADGEVVIDDSGPHVRHTRKVGTDTDPSGTPFPYTTDKWVDLGDGSYRFTHTGPGLEAQGAGDGAGNESYSSRQEMPGGGSILVTRTKDAAGHGTEHLTLTDAQGNVERDETTSY